MLPFSTRSHTSRVDAQVHVGGMSNRPSSWKVAYTSPANLSAVACLLWRTWRAGLAPTCGGVGEDAFEEDGGGFGVGVLGSPVLGEFALDCRLEDSGSIPLQVGSHPLQGGDPGIEVGEEFLDLGDDATLFFSWGNGDGKFSKILDIEPGNGLPAVARQIGVRTNRERRTMPDIMRSTLS